MTNVQGMVASGWEAVRDAFEANFTDRGDVGAGVAVVHDGQLVVDLVGGHRDAERTVAYTPDTLQLVFSTTKGMTAVCVALCVERGWISPATRVQELWPDLQADVTVEQLMSHQAGLITIEPPLALEAALDLAAVTKGLEGTTPDWEPGTAHGYHAITYGWLAGELVRRADPQRRTLGRFFADEVAQPLALDAWIGLPSSEESRVAPMIAAEPITDPAVLGLMEMMMGPTTRGGRALSLSGTFGQFAASSGTQMPWNTPAVRAAEIGAANGITNARSLARMYAATVGPVDGVRLLAADTVEMARAPRVKGPDACLLVETAFGLGFMLDSPFNPMLAPGSFGHPGAGGSVAFADPEAGIGFGYVMNQMQNNLSADPRQGALIEAVRSCL
jgi:CubicO group peptidase (beta-lactamase class C family)